MSNVLQNGFLSTLSILFGYALGASARYVLGNYFNYLFSKTYISTLLINTMATVALSILFLSMKNFNTFCIAFLGSFSTFSTWVYELFELSRKRKFYEFSYLIFIAISLSTVILFLVYFAANAN